MFQAKRTNLFPSVVSRKQEILSLNRSSIDRHICVVGESGPIQFVPRNGVVKCIARS
jgi:hypothetical protein